MLQDNATEPFPLEGESCFLGGELRACSSPSPALSAVPTDCSQRWLFPSVLTFVVPLGVSLIGKIPAIAAIFKASAIHNFLLVAQSAVLMWSSGFFTNLPCSHPVHCLVSPWGNQRFFQPSWTVSELPEGILLTEFLKLIQIGLNDCCKLF